MRIFKSKEFNKWSKKLLCDTDLLKAISEMKSGLYDAKLGANLFKKRLPLRNSGKRGGVRTILAFKSGQVAVFIYGFQKSEIDNITEKESNALKELAKVYIDFSDVQYDKAIKSGNLIEVKNEKIHS